MCVVAYLSFPDRMPERDVTVARQDILSMRHGDTMPETVTLETSKLATCHEVRQIPYRFALRTIQEVDTIRALIAHVVPHHGGAFAS